jgi:hypothetical protein
MRVLSNTLYSGAAICCGAVISLGGIASAYARPVAMQAHSAAPMSGAHMVHQGHSARLSREQFRHAIDHRVRRGQSFGSGYYTGPYWSGTFQSTQPDEGAPPIPSDYPDDYGRRPQPCVVPVVIELRPSWPSRHMPEITYGSPSFCPPPVVAEAR